MPDFSTANPILAEWAKTLRRQPRRTAIFGADGAALRTFEQVENEALALVAGFPERAAAGAIAVVELGNHAALPSVLIALWRRGYTVTLAEVGSAVSLPGIALRVRRGEGDCVDFSAFASEPVAGLDADFLKLTSGTTGAPRAIRFTAAQLLADCEAVCDTMRITDADLNFGVISWAHSYGFSNLVLPLICRGVPLVASEDRLPRAILAGLARSSATVFPSVPVFFKKLAELDTAPLPKLRLCISAGAPLPSAVAAVFREKFGVKVHSFYGSSECGGICYDASEESVPEGFVGLPMRGVKLSESGGRLEIHSPAAALGYWPQPEPAILGDGRFIPEDIVERSDKGFTLCGRESDFINVAGRKLNPAEVERIFRAHPAVRDVVVFGVPSTLRGEEPVACIVAQSTTAELLAFAGAQLPAWQMPKHIWLAESLPVNERGKLSRRALSAAWQASQK